MDCVFCKIIRNEKKGHIIYEDDSHMAFLDRYPITEGHSLIVPKKHYERITDMPQDEAGRLFSIAPRIARAVLKSTGADAFSLGQNNGRAANQVVLHVHVHIIPGYADRDTVWTRRGRPTDMELAGLASKIRDNFAAADK